MREQRLLLAGSWIDGEDALLVRSPWDGRVVAREDMDRLRAWLDDEEQDTLPGEGPRAAVVAIAVGTANMAFARIAPPIPPAIWAPA